MFAVRKHWKIWVVGASVMGIIGVGALLSSTGSGSTQSPAPSELRTVSRELLDGSQLGLSKPSSADSTTYASGQAEAERTALEAWPGATVSETALLQVEDALSDPPAKCLCWVIVLASTEPVYIAHPIPSNPNVVESAFVPESTFRLALVDARTGKYVYGVEGAHGRQETK